VPRYPCDKHTLTLSASRAAVTDQSVSDLVNDAVAKRMNQDEEDLRVLRERRKEPSRPYEDFLKELKRDGLI